MITETLDKQRGIFTAITTSTQARNSSYRADEGRKWTSSYERDHDRTRSTRESVHARSRSHAHPEYRPRYNSGYHAPQRIIEDVIYVENPPRDLQFQLSPTDPGGYRDLLLQDCCDLIDKRTQDFDGMNRKAADLETWVRPHSISATLSLTPRLFLHPSYTPPILTEHPKNRLQQRPARKRRLRLHHRHHRLPPPQHRRLHHGHEH